MSHTPLARPLSPRLIAATTAVLLPLGLLVAAPLANAAPTPAPPGNFTSSFESADPQPATSTVEVGANGKPVQANLSGTVATPARQPARPGQRRDRERREPAAARSPRTSRTTIRRPSGSAFAPTGWVTYQLAKPATVATYSLTSADDAPSRDPKDFTVQGSNDGSTWTDLDKRAGEKFSGRFATNDVQLHQHERVRLLPAQRHRELR